MLFLIFALCTPVFAADNGTPEITDFTPWIEHSVSVIKLCESDDGERFFNEVKKHAPKGYTKKMVKDFFMICFL